MTKPTTSTMLVIADRASDPDALVMAGELAELRIIKNALSLRASKVLHLLVKAAGADACDDLEHTITIAELNETFHLSVGEFIQTARELSTTGVELRYRDEAGDDFMRFGPLLSDLQRQMTTTSLTDPMIVRWQFSPIMRMVLGNSDHWAALSRKAVLAFEGRYALRLYELVTLRSGLKYKSHERFEVDDLRRRLGVEPKKLVSWIHFRQRCLDPAVAEVNQLSGLQVRYEVVKTARKVTAIDLTWRELNPAGRAVQARELEASRVGRKARRDETVEAIADVLPAVVTFPTGSIRGTPFEVIARENLRGTLPDLDQVAERFRSWANRDRKPLRGDRVTMMFAGFCKSQKPID